MASQIAVAERAEQCARYRVEQHVAIRVPLEAPIEGDFDSADSKRAPRHELVGIDSVADPHFPSPCAASDIALRSASRRSSVCLMSSVVMDLLAAGVCVLVLPLIDLLILFGWTTLSIGGVLKAIYATTNYRPTLVGMGPLDCVIAAGVFLLLALALAARTWVKLNEPKLVAARRSVRARSVYEAHANGNHAAVGAISPEEAPLEAASVRGAGAGGVG